MALTFPLSELKKKRARNSFNISFRATKHVDEVGKWSLARVGAWFQKYNLNDLQNICSLFGNCIWKQEDTEDNQKTCIFKENVLIVF